MTRNLYFFQMVHFWSGFHCFPIKKMPAILPLYHFKVKMVLYILTVIRIYINLTIVVSGQWNYNYTEITE